MREEFLHFIWQFQYFHSEDLSTTEGQKITILEKGILNHDSGADFGLAKILIDQIEWVGNIEIHLKSSDWNQHRHQEDEAYNNVMLHIVWEADKIIHRKDGTMIPTLVLKDRVDKTLLYRYQGFLNSLDIIPCASQFEKVDRVHKILMLDKAVIHRLESKADFARTLLIANQYDWEETTYQLLAKNFGFHTNGEPFLELSKNIPLKILHKNSDQLHKMEALLFGQSGFLDNMDTPDTYTENLQKEHSFLSQKYGLEEATAAKKSWKSGRIRPANFPTVRIAQFAALIFKEKSLFTLFCEEDTKTIVKRLKVKQSEYWQKHYNFRQESNLKVPFLGKSSIENILINTVVPLLVLVAKEKSREEYMERAIGILENLPAEKNKILSNWEALGMKVKTAFDSQALIEQYNEFCSQKKCLNCTIGLKLVKQDKVSI